MGKPLTISLKADMSAVERELGRIDQKDKWLAASAGINVAVRKVRTTALREIAQIKRVPTKWIRFNFKVRKKASPRRPWSHVHWLHRGVPLALLNPRSTAKGVRAGRHSVDGGFIANDVTGRRQGFQRETESTPRLPVHVQSIKLEPEGTSIVTRHTARAGTFFAAEFNRYLTQRLRYVTR